MPTNFGQWCIIYFYILKEQGKALCSIILSPTNPHFGWKILLPVMFANRTMDQDISRPWVSVCCTEEQIGYSLMNLVDLKVKVRGNSSHRTVEQAYRVLSVRSRTNDSLMNDLMTTQPGWWNFFPSTASFVQFPTPVIKKIKH